MIPRNPKRRVVNNKQPSNLLLYLCDDQEAKHERQTVTVPLRGKE